MGGTTLHAGIVANGLTFCFCNVFEDMLLWSSMGFDLV